MAKNHKAVYIHFEQLQTRYIHTPKSTHKCIWYSLSFLKASLYWLWYRRRCGRHHTDDYFEGAICRICRNTDEDLVPSGRTHKDWRFALHQWVNFEKLKVDRWVINSLFALAYTCSTPKSISLVFFVAPEASWFIFFVFLFSFSLCTYTTTPLSHYLTETISLTLKKKLND